jgi:hypothetical protein
MGVSRWIPGTVILIGLCACGAQHAGTLAPTGPSSGAAAASPLVSELAIEPTPTPISPAIPDAVDVESVPGDFGPLEADTRYYARPVVPNGPTIYVLYTIPADGWVAWIGSFKPGEEGRDQTVALHVLNVTSLVRHGCTDHGMADPPVGSRVEDLATALTTLEPFQVVEQPAPVSRWGYNGMRLVLRTPDLPTTVAGGQLSWTGCQDRELKSWIGRPLSYAYYGYSPGLIEEFWILDIEGQRLVVATDHFPDTPPGDMEELDAVLDSIEIVVEENGS